MQHVELLCKHLHYSDIMFLSKISKIRRQNIMVRRNSILEMERSMLLKKWSHATQKDKATLLTEIMTIDNEIEISKKIQKKLVVG
jgi:hypothetical protein